MYSKDLCVFKGHHNGQISIAGSIKESHCWKYMIIRTLLKLMFDSLQLTHISLFFFLFTCCFEINSIIVTEFNANQYLF